MKPDTKYRLKVAIIAAISLLIIDVSLLALVQNGYISSTTFNIVALACNFLVFLSVIVLVNRREYKSLAAAKMKKQPTA